MTNSINACIDTCFSDLTKALLMLGFVVALTPSALADNNGSARLMEQLTEFNGGCPPNECANVQFSIHRAHVCTNGPNANLINPDDSAIYSTSMVRKTGSNELAGGSSTLVRTVDGVAFNLSTTGLAPNAPYTVWWVGFALDNPCIVEGGLCDCAGIDLRPGLDSVFWATGGMSDELGSATFSANIDYGDLPDGFDQVPVAANAPLLEGAEIHIVVRKHGSALKGNGGAGNKN